LNFRAAISALFGRAGQPVALYETPLLTEIVEGMSPEVLYRTQPHLRTVVSFVARNVAQLGLPVYERVSNTDRKRVHDDPAAALLRRPNPNMTGYELRESLVSDLALYDNAYWFLHRDAEAGWTIHPIPAGWITGSRGGTLFAPEVYLVTNPDGTRTEIAADDLLVFRGWNPGEPRHGSSPVAALKQILAEQIHAWSYRSQIWERGGRVGTYLTRPADAPDWSKEAREKFSRDWRAKWTGRGGSQAGGTPVLEDGMTLNATRFNAREEEWAEVAKLSLATVAAVYHVNPVMVGVLDNANYSNVREFRKMLYGETLGPMLAMVEDRINNFLLPRVSEKPRLYTEFNIREKLQGDFQETAQLLSSAVGAPYMTTNEARSFDNLPSIPGGDQLVTPLNVLLGRQASPRDSGSQNLGAAGAAPEAKAGARTARIKSSAFPDKYSDDAEALFARFFRRQAAAVRSAVGAKSPDYWDEERWNTELANDLYALAVRVATEVGRQAAAGLGFDPGDYSERRTFAFLRAVSEARARWVNATTLRQLEAALAAADDSDDAAAPDPVRHVFEVADNARASTSGRALAAAVAGFAVTEAAQQLRPEATKTWETSGADPRPEHAAMDGETVPIKDLFSNGANWPGDPVLGAEGVANCECGVTVESSW